MSRHGNPYLQLRTYGGVTTITIHKAVSNGHSVVQRGVAPSGDVPALRTEIKRCIDRARLGDPRWEIQADGDN